MNVAPPNHRGMAPKNGGCWHFLGCNPSSYSNLGILPNGSLPKAVDIHGQYLLPTNPGSLSLYKKQWSNDISLETQKKTSSLAFQKMASASIIDLMIGNTTHQQGPTHRFIRETPD